MTDPLTFTSATPRHALPTLFAGQAQKEFSVNEALARLDALTHPCVEGESSTPPSSPSPGEAWLVAEGGSGAWSAHDGKLACFTGGSWIFSAPTPGMQVFDRQAGVRAVYDGEWHRSAAVGAPSGGATVDSEARAAIAGLIDALVIAGIVPQA